jgi:hypothetical protein
VASCASRPALSICRRAGTGFFFSALENSDSRLGDSDDLVVTDELTIYRRAPGRYETPRAADQIGPVVLMAVSVIALTAGLVVSINEKAPPLGPVAILGGGAGMVGGGVWAYGSSRATQQDGTSTIWRVPVSRTLTKTNP